MRIAIIGAGISGAILAHELKNTVVFERSSSIGGRLAQGYFTDQNVFDQGATLFKESVDYIQNGKQSSFNFLQYLQNNIPNLQTKSLTSYANAYFAKSGMQDIAKQLLAQTEVRLNHNLERISRTNGENQWILHFSNKIQSTFDIIIFTQPIPIAISTLKNSGIMQDWDNFTKFTSEYRSCLVLTAIWKNLPEKIVDKIQNLPSTSLQKDIDDEYISIESNKYPPETKSTVIISIQFSAAFSSRNLERWCDKEQTPLPVAITSGKVYFEKFFERNQIPEMSQIPPYEMKARKWRYSSMETPLLPANEAINFDSKIFQSYQELCQKYGVWLSGDWIWASKIPRCAIGKIILSDTIKILYTNKMNQ
ncbi:MAG: FAD-dependent oxidoreductase [Spirochaetota bacterium]